MNGLKLISLGIVNGLVSSVKDFKINGKLLNIDIDEGIVNARYDGLMGLFEIEGMDCNSVYDKIMSIVSDIDEVNNLYSKVGKQMYNEVIVINKLNSSVNFLKALTEKADFDKFTKQSSIVKDWVEGKSIDEPCCDNDWSKEEIKRITEAMSQFEATPEQSEEFIKVLAKKPKKIKPKIKDLEQSKKFEILEAIVKIKNNIIDCSFTKINNNVLSIQRCYSLKEINVIYKGFRCPFFKSDKAIKILYSVCEMIKNIDNINTRKPKKSL